MGKEQALLAPAGISARCWDSVSAGRGNDFLSEENKETFNASRLLKTAATKMARVSVEKINNLKYEIKCNVNSSNSHTNYRLKWNSSHAHCINLMSKAKQGKLHHLLSGKEDKLL